MKRRKAAFASINNASRFERYTPIFVTLIAAVCGLLGALVGVYWQTNSSHQLKIYEARVEAYEEVLLELKQKPKQSLKKMNTFAAQSRLVSTDGDMFILESDWYDFIESDEGKEATEILKAALYPLILHGSDKTVRLTQAIFATLELEYPEQQLRIADLAIAKDFLHAIDPNTPCYGCNDRVERHVSARLLTLNSLLNKLENRMFCDLSSSSTLCL